MNRITKGREQIVNKTFVKMMDELGDIVLDDDGSGPAIIDDYLDDVKAKMA